MREFTLDYRYLKAFLLTAKYLNFSKAAEELNIAQSAISRQVKLLEDSIGQELIIRSSKKVILTEKGQELLQIIEKFENEVFTLFLGDEHRPVRVGILHGLLENWFHQIIKEFTSDTNHQLEVVVASTEILKKKLQEKEFDVIFSTENIQTEIMSSLKIMEEKLVFISRGNVDTKEPWNHTWIIYDENDLLMHLYKKRAKQVIKVTSMTSVITLVKEGLGIAIVPDHLLKGEQKLTITEIKGIPKTQVYMTTLNYKTIPEPLNSLVKIIRN